MIAIAKSPTSSNSQPSWHDRFLELLPAIRRHARFAFRRMDAELHEELVQEVVANALRAFLRLWEQGRVVLAHAGPLARYAIRQVRQGRRVGDRLNVRDVTSIWCQNRKGVCIERLPERAEGSGWREIVVEDRRAGPAETAVARLDITAWLRSLPKRDRAIAQALAAGETTKTAAARFKISAGRISQLRRELHEGWLRFQGESGTAAGSMSE